MDLAFQGNLYGIHVVESQGQWFSDVSLFMANMLFIPSAHSYRIYMPWPVENAGANTILSKTDDAPDFLQLSISHRDKQFRIS